MKTGIRAFFGLVVSVLLTGLVGSVYAAPTGAGGTSRIELRIYHAEWCGPCHEYRAMRERNHIDQQVSITIGASSFIVPIVEVDTENSEHLRRYPEISALRSIPTTRLFIGQTMAGETVGALPTSGDFINFVTRSLTEGLCRDHNLRGIISAVPGQPHPCGP